MDTVTLKRLLDLRLDDICFTFVGGKDELPELPPFKPAALIFNTETSNLAGQHWVASYVDTEKRNAYYYDSTGSPIPPMLLNRLTVTPFTSVHETNRDTHQSSDSALCGLFCVTWLDIVSSEGFFPKFLPNQDFNDIVVLLFLQDELKTLFQ